MSKQKRGGDSPIELAKTIEASRARIDQLRAELQSEERIARVALGRLRVWAGISDDSAPSPRLGRETKTAIGRGAKSAAIVAFIESKPDPQDAEAVAAHVRNKVANVRQGLMNLVKAGTLASYKKVGEDFKKPGKGERGGYYGLAR